MADEYETSPAIEGAEASPPVTAAEPKKQRKPRQKKVIAEAASPVSAPATVKGPRKKSGAHSVETTKASNDTLAVSESKPSRGRKPGPQPRATKTTAAVPLSVVEAPLDEIADFVALEAENRRLRQALSEKLRAENADLRKRLGQA